MIKVPIATESSELHRNLEGSQESSNKAAEPQKPKRIPEGSQKYPRDPLTKVPIATDSSELQKILEGSQESFNKAAKDFKNQKESRKDPKSI